MLIKENKKPVAIALCSAIFVAILGAYMYYTGFGDVALVATAVCVVSAFFCTKRLLSNNYIEILDDTLRIVRGNESYEFKYADINDINMRRFNAGKKSAELLNFEFKRTLELENRFNFLRFYSDRQATMPDIYESSVYEINRILREKLGLEAVQIPESKLPKNGKKCK